MICPYCGIALESAVRRDAGYCLGVLCGTWLDGRDLAILTRNIGEVEHALNDPANHADLTAWDERDLKAWLKRAKAAIRWMKGATL